jgi:hypothetical protein
MESKCCVNGPNTNARLILGAGPTRHLRRQEYHFQIGRLPGAYLESGQVPGEANLRTTKERLIVFRLRYCAWMGRC